MAQSRVLIVDDERLMRWSLRWHLERAGHRVLEAETGRQALRNVRRGVELVLLDLKLPDIDGLELFQAIRRENPHCPVILMTAQNSPAVALEAERRGVYRVVDKPFAFPGMVGLVGEALKVHGQ